MGKELAEKQINEVQVIAPDQFIQRAIDNGSDITVLNGLFELKQKHEAHEAKKAFARAMHRFQEIKPVLKKTKEVSFGGGKAAYKFCPISEIEKSLKEPLAECDLSYRFENVQKDGQIGVRCIVTHIMGHSESTEMYAPADSSGNKNSIQGIGSTNTYLMRYTLIAALSLTSADEDDDGVSSGDMPYLKLLEHNAALRNNLEAVLAIKLHLAENELQDAFGAIHELPEETQRALWVAPTKGGIFETEEIAKMKSDEWGAARRAYFEENE